MVSTSMATVGTCALLLGGFATNELSHGVMSEAMGFGHRHMFDYGGDHCASPNAADGSWERHVEHMHDGDPNATHAGCGDHHHAGMSGGGPHASGGMMR